MPVVLDLRAFGHIVAELAEDVHDFLADDGDGMAGPQLEGVTRHGEVLLRGQLHGRGRDLVLQLLDLGRGGFLEFVELLAVFALEFRSDGAELLHQRGDTSFLSEEADPSLFHLFLCGGLEPGKFLLDLFDGFFHTSFSSKIPQR